MIHKNIFRLYVTVKYDFIYCTPRIYYPLWIHYRISDLLESVFRIKKCNAGIRETLES